MASIVVSGDTSGTVTLSAPAVSGTTTLTLPTTSGTVLQNSSPSITTPNIIGVTNGSDAAAGSVGEYVVSTVTSPGTTLTNNTALNLTSISLTAGDWDVSGSVYFTGSGTVSTLNWIMGNVQTTSASIGAGNLGMLIQTPLNTGAWTQTDIGGVCGPTRFSLSSTTTVYLVTRASYTGGTLQSYGQIRARRIR